MKNACYMRKVLFVSVDKKMISLPNEWYIENAMVCEHFRLKLAHGIYCLCSIMWLFRL